MPPREGLDGLVAELLSAVDQLDQPVVLVLEDLHEVDSGAVYADLSRALRRPSANLRIIVSTRVDPPFALGRISVAGDLVELRGDDLAFTLEETRALFDLFEPRIDDADCELLWRRTEGWAAGLRLAASALRAHSDPSAFVADFAGGDGAIADYLVGEVLMREEPSIGDFMMRASILERLVPDMVATVTGRDDSAALLADLHHRHAFVTPVDSHREAYVMHPLVREFLQARLRYQSPQEVAVLHRRAALWMSAAEQHVGALRHAVAGGHVDLAARIAARHWIDAAVSGELGVLRRLLERLPPERIEADPRLQMALACALAERGETQRAQRLLARARGDADDETLAAMRLAAELYLARASADGGAAVAAARALNEHAQAAAALRDEEDLRAFAHTHVGVASLWSGDAAGAQRELEHGLVAARAAGSDWLEFSCLAYLAVTAIMTGHFSAIARRADSALELGERRGWSRTTPAGAALLARGVACYENGELAAAERALDRADLALRGTRDPPLKAALDFHRALVLQDRGQVEPALELLDAAVDEIDGWYGLPSLLGAIGAQRALLRVGLGRGDADRRTLAGQYADAAERRRAGRRPGQAVAERRRTRATRATGSGPCWPATASPILPLLIEAWVLEALACDQLADHAAAARALESALELAEPSGMKRALLSGGAALRPVLHRHVHNGTAHRTLVDVVLHELDDSADDRPTPVHLLEALSDRETAVLRYLPTMMSNQEIAGELFVTVNTVKTHLRAIYRKLDVGDRRAAVRRARDLSLLAP